MSKYILFSSLYAGVIGTGNEPPRSQTAAVVGAFGLSDRPRTRTEISRIDWQPQASRTDLTGSPRSAQSRERVTRH